MAVREKFIWGPDLSDHGPDKHLDFNVEAVSWHFSVSQNKDRSKKVISASSAGKW